MIKYDKSNTASLLSLLRPIVWNLIGFIFSTRAATMINTFGEIINNIIDY